MLLLIGTLAVVFFWLSLVCLLGKWPRNGRKTISQHSAKSRNTYIFFSISQTITGLMSHIFVIVWFIPHFHLSVTYTIIYSVMATLQLVSTWIPDIEKGLSSKLHTFLANSMALSLFVFMLVLTTTSRIPVTGRWFAGISALYMLVIIIGIYTKLIKQNYLYFQIAYIVLFQVTILTLAYLF